MKKMLSLVFLLTLLTTFSCDTTTNPTSAPKADPSVATTIAGTILPKGISATITVTQGETSYTTTCNTSGYYRINDLFPGSCIITVSAAGYGTYRTSRSLEPSGINHTYDIILTTLPYPISSISPGQSEWISLSSSFYLYFQTPMDTASVRRAVTITPATAISAYYWTSEYQNLSIIPKTTLKPGTRYTVVIDTSVRTAKNEQIEFACSTWFKTAPFKVTYQYPDSGSTMSIYNDAQISLTAPAAKASAQSRIRAVPAMDLLITLSGTQVYIGPLTGNWAENTDYFIIIDDSLADVNGIILGDSVVLSFNTSSSGSSSSGITVNINPVDSSDGFSGSSDITVSFGTSMNTTSVEKAFKLKDSTGAVITGSTSWSGTTYFYFSPNTTLHPSSRYTITIDSTAQSRGSIAIKNTRSTFWTKGFEITGSSPGAGTYNQSLNSNIYLYFNAPSNNASVEQAVSITPALNLDYTWSGNTLYGNLRDDYLRSNTEYTVTVDTSATDFWGSHLAKPHNIIFRTVPATVTSYSPAFK
jgi:hypothetical protein